MVCNSGFENMNEFLLTFRECRNAYTDYQRQYESWKNACRKPDTPTHKDEKLSDKLARLQRGKIICPLFYILLTKLR